jgi:triosephosphate isomerase
MRKKLVAGNWKMHGSHKMADGLVREIVEGLERQKREHNGDVDVLVIPPVIYLADLVHKYRDPHPGLGFGAQTISEHPEQGAFTGEISGAMVRDVGAKWTLVGHSERRQYYHETDALLSKKFRTACDAGLTPIYCVGETQEEHEAGKAEEVIGRQLAAVIDVYGVEAFRTGVIAYEPVWAIGTGLTATPDKVQKIHAFIRSQVAKKDVNISLLTRVLYGGSVKPANAADLFAQPDVDGGLIGGAALVASDFLEICAAARR